jgi:hypothetical protein
MRTESHRGTNESLLIALLWALVALASPAQAANLTAGKIAQSYGSLPLAFEANRGQAAPEVRFISRQRGFGLFLTSTEAVLVLSQPDIGTSSRMDEPGRMLERTGGRQDPKATILRMQLIGGHRNPDVVCEEELPGKVNYLVGQDSGQWQTGIRTFGRIKFLEVYPRIDLVYYGRHRQLEYDFVVKPGANPKAIALNIEGADALEIATNGALVLHVGSQQVRFDKPILYQQLNGARKEIEGAYRLEAGNRVAFAVAAYDPRSCLVIDPVLSYSTYLGGALGNEGMDLTLDPDGNAYVTGTTSSTNFPVVNAVASSLSGSVDIFVAKLNPAGSALLYSTYLGGTGNDLSRRIKVDAVGNAYVVGSTDSTNFPVTSGAFGTAPQGLYDAFVAKLNPEGSALVYSTLLGGSGNDSGQGIALDADRNVYVTGTTSSDRIPFPTTGGAFETARHFSNDVYVAKLNTDGSGLIYSTFLGGDGADLGYGIAVDAARAAYVTGSTTSTNFPTTPGAFGITHHSQADVFVTKIDPSGSALVYSALLGGDHSEPYYPFQEEPETGRAIAVDGTGAAYVTGWTQSTNFPTTLGAFGSSNHGGSKEAFLTKLDPGGSTLAYSARIGGTGGGRGRAIAVDANGAAYVTGETVARDFPVTPGAFDGTGNITSLLSYEVFLIKLNPEGSALVYSTCLGGTGSDFGRGIALDAAGDVYLTGTSYSHDFPTSRTAFVTHSDLGEAPNGGSDVFVTKITPLPAPWIVSGPIATPTSALVNQPFSFSLVATDLQSAPLSYTWEFGDGATGSGNPVTHAYAALGRFFATVAVSNGVGSREATAEVMVRPPNTASGSLRFSETYARRVGQSCSGTGWGEVCFPVIRYSGRHVTRATLSLGDVDVSQFNSETPFAFRVGNFEFAGRLGDDTNYVNGAARANIALASDRLDWPRRLPPIGARLRWDSQILKVTITGITAWSGAGTEGVSPILATELLGTPTGLTEHVVPVGLSLGSAAALFDVPCHARTWTGKEIMVFVEWTLPSVVRIKGQGAGLVGQ